jgi:Tfp pilus assembly protein PilO
MASKKSQDKHSEVGTNSYIAMLVGILVVLVMICAIAANSLVHSLILNTKVISKKSKAKSQLDTKVANAPQLIDAYHNLGNTKQLVLDALPTTADFPQIVTIADNLTASAGVSLKSVTPQPSVAPTTGTSSTGASSSASSTTSGATSSSSSSSTSTTAQPTSYTYTMSVEGQYDRLMLLLKNLEQSSRVMRVNSIKMQSSGATVTADFEVQTYYQDKADISEKTEVIK